MNTPPPEPGMPSRFTLAWRGVRFHWRTELSVLAGIILSAAVLVGALLVGDSVHYSLARFAYLRLGHIQLAIDSPGRFFNPNLATALADRLDTPVAAVLRLPGMALRETTPGAEPIQVNQVQVLGVDPAFNPLAPVPPPNPDTTSVTINTKLATALGAKPGDTIALRIQQPTLLPHDAPLSSRAGPLSKRASLKVAAILSDEQLARFSLSANQVEPYNAFVSRDWLQQRVNLPSRANTLLVGAQPGRIIDPATADAALQAVWNIRDTGLLIRAIPDNAGLQLESERIFLDPQLSEPALHHATGTVGLLTYLVNSISTTRDGNTRTTPYSFLLGASPSANTSLSPVPLSLQDHQILINPWLAEQLSISTGDTVTVRYHQLAGANTWIEQQRNFTVADIPPMAHFTMERDLTPDFPGLTDVEQCADWDIGMPIDKTRLADKDNEKYWQTYRATPKAIVTLTAAREMWANRFGNLSAVRYNTTAGNADNLFKALSSRIAPSSLGLTFSPVRQSASQAVNQAMNFGELFLSMSFFLILAALLLTAMLFVFTIRQRAPEMGTWLALGFTPGHLRVLFLGEGAILALLGALLGAWLGTFYTHALIWGLAHPWRGAIAGAAIQYHAEPASIATGIAAALLCALLAIAGSIWRQTRHPIRALLSGEIDNHPIPSPSTATRYRLYLPTAALAATTALTTVIYAQTTRSEHHVYAFFTAGSLLLIAGLLACAEQLRRLEICPPANLTLFTLGLRNAARRKGRSLTCIALLATGSFMVCAVSSMQDDLARHAAQRSAGTGGFTLFAQSTLPIPDPLETPAGMKRFNLQLDQRLTNLAPVSIKVREGDDASCLNLNRAQTPRLLGVDPAAFAARKAFLPEHNPQPLWEQLQTQLAASVIPGIVGDTDTAQWNLQKKVGPTTGDLITYQDEQGQSFHVKLIAALPMRRSLFQGSILISEKNFAERFPSEAGYRLFLFDTPANTTRQAATALTQRMSTIGLDVTTALDRLREFHAVESTYLAMFLVLGGLGLLLGTVGMGVVVLRNVMERRAELATLRCLGFSRSQTLLLLIAEHWLLLTAGLTIGTLASIVAIWPNLQTPGMHVPIAGIVTILAAILILGLVGIALAAQLAIRGMTLSALRDE